jgi:hypothetical protein
MGEMVSVPAKLLADLIWAAESLSDMEPDEDDRAMILAARRALEEQAPEMAYVMLEIDVACAPHDVADGLSESTE